jgi:hypothetical protein
MLSSLLVLLAGVAAVLPLQAITIPAGFNLTNSWQGTGSGGTGTAIRIYRKDFAGGQPDFVTVVDLRFATLRSIIGGLGGVSPCSSVGTRVLCTSSSGGCTSSSHWNAASGAGQGLRVLLNGTFFATGNNPAGIAFGLRQNGTIISYGYGVESNAMDCANASEFPGNTFTFRFNNGTDQATTGNYSFAQFTDPAFPDLIGGLNPTCCKSPSSFVPRTMVGVRDDNADGKIETVLFYSSAFARLSDGNNTLRAFGATATMQLDGGGSTGLVVAGSQSIATTRPMPHAIAIYAQ